MNHDDLSRILDETPDIADGGFTARVMTAIAVRASAARLSARARAAIVLGFAVVACALAYLLSGGCALSGAIAKGVHGVQAGGVATVAALGVMACIAVLVVVSLRGEASD
jgi:hypothetical protein